MLLALLIFAALAPQAGAARPVVHSYSAVVVTYSNGRVEHHLVDRNVRIFEADMIPRIADWPATQPHYLLQVRWYTFKGDVRVEVWVGSGHGQAMVARITLRQNDTVNVPLDRYGIEPIRLSLEKVSMDALFRPTVSSRIENLQISAVALLNGGEFPGYRITVRNLSPIGVVSFLSVGYAAGNVRFRGFEYNQSGRAVIEPGGEYSFDWELTSGSNSAGSSWPPRPIESIEVTYIVWADDTAQGEPLAQNAEKLTPPSLAAIGRRVQSERIAEILGRAVDSADPRGGAAGARRAIAELKDYDERQLPAAQAAMKDTKAEALAEISAIAARDANRTDTYLALGSMLEKFHREARRGIPYP
jgi:hypothetical protein